MFLDRADFKVKWSREGVSGKTFHSNRDSLFHTKRIHGVNKSVFYAIADGLFAVLSRCKAGHSGYAHRRSRNLCNIRCLLMLASVGVEKMENSKLKFT